MEKKLELADLLYETGNWQQAVAEYRQVIERQHQLIDVHLQLGKILQLMGLEKEALEVYEKALLLSDNKGTQNHINGLIAVCRGESQKAIIAFNLAAALEPDKVVHWLALAQVHQGRENPIGTLSTLERVLSVNPDDVVALIHSYDALMAVGDIQLVACVFAVVIAFNLFTSNASALGGFSRTCREASVSGSSLKASCERANGGFNPTSIALNPYIGNIDGRFSWNDRNFIETCRNTTLKSGSNLSAECKKRDQNFVSTSINLDEHIANIDGNLRHE